MGSSSRIGSQAAHQTLDMFLKESFLCLFLIIADGSAQSCCPTKKVAGADSLAGTYTLFDGTANFLPICMDQCAYKKEGNADPDELFCFKTEGAIHDVECDASGATSAPAGGACDYSKGNLSWGEYQTKIPMPAGMSPPFEVIMTFDAVTTIGSCHSNCNHATAGNKPDCVGKVCTVTYTGTDKLEMLNIKKDNPASENDRSNLVSVTVNGAEQC